jgi:putative flippase GtrA
VTQRALVPRLLFARRGRYLIIACLCAALHNAIMIAGDRSGVGYPVMTLASFLILTPTAYALHTRFTFAEQFSVKRLLRFASGTAVGLPLSLLAMGILCTLLKLPVLVATPIATVALFVWNYASTHMSILGRPRRN